VGSGKNNDENSLDLSALDKQRYKMKKRHSDSIARIEHFAIRITSLLLLIATLVKIILADLRR
jgi:hypothetical protein